MVSKISLIVIVAMGLFLTGCVIDSGLSEFCDRTLTMDGSVNDTDVYSDAYSMQAVWFNSSAEEHAIDDLDKEVMGEMGLDPEDNEDVSRYIYWTTAYDLRMILAEELDESSMGGLTSTIGRDFSIYYFDLEASSVQPGTSIDVFDISSLEPLRDAGDTEALGAELRRLVDGMRDNGKPDALVAFVDDRSEENDLNSMFINLFSPTARFASSGTASFYGLVDDDGGDMINIDYPMAHLDAISFGATVLFSKNENVTVEAVCFKAAISN